MMSTHKWYYSSAPDGSDGKESTCHAGDPSSIPGSGRSHGEGNGNPLQYSCLENPMDRGDCPWQRVKCDWSDLARIAHVEV